MKQLTLPLLTSFLILQPFVPMLSIPQIALADTPASSCAKGLLFNSWGQRTELSENVVATCQGVTTDEESQAIQSCVKGLLFNSWGQRTSLSEDITTVCNGMTTGQVSTSVQNCVKDMLFNSWGQRTGVSENAAVKTCSINTTPSAQTNQQSSEQISRCVEKQMYTQREICTDPWGQDDPSCFFRSNPSSGKRTISEATGVTLERARATCGVQPLPAQSQQPIYPVQGSNPQAVSACMDKLMYQTEVQKPFPGWICVSNDVNCKTVRVRTEVSEGSAAVACQNAR